MILDGKKLAEKIKSRLRVKIAKSGLRPGLASILVGNNPASALYISIKEREAKKVGIHFEKYHIPHLTPPPLRGGGRRGSEKIINLIKKLNRDSKIHGILTQMPLPRGFDTNKIIRAIDPEKDVDGFHPENVKLLRAGKPRFVSPPHGAVLALLNQALKNLKLSFRRRHNTKLSFKAVIVANSETFAEPLKLLLEKLGIKTQIIFSKLNFSARGGRQKLSFLKKADIIIVAKGKPKFITANMVKKGAIVIDVGTNRVAGKVVGDVDFAAVSKKAAWITPVPGGVGPMTVAMLLQNVLRAAMRSLRHRDVRCPSGP